MDVKMEWKAEEKLVYTTSFLLSAKYRWAGHGTRHNDVPHSWGSLLV